MKPAVTELVIVTHQVTAQLQSLVTALICYYCNNGRLIPS